MFYIRTVRPDLATRFAMEHDEQIWRCFSTLLGVNPEALDAHSKASTSLPLVMGGLGLRSASRLRDAAHWGSWADKLKMVHERHRMVADVILRAMAVRSEAPAIEAINQSVENLLAVGYDVPTWESLMTNRNVPVAEVEEPNQPRVGWQASASRAVETSFMRRLLLTLSDSEAALFRSQLGPLASGPFVSIPWDRTCRLEPASSPSPPSPPHNAYLPMWPSSRRPWPPSVSVCSCGEVGSQGISAGKCSRQGVSGG